MCADDCKHSVSCTLTICAHSHHIIWDCGSTDQVPLSHHSAEKYSTTRVLIRQPFTSNTVLVDGPTVNKLSMFALKWTKYFIQTWLQRKRFVPLANFLNLININYLAILQHLLSTQSPAHTPAHLAHRRVRPSSPSHEENSSLVPDALREIPHAPNLLQR